MGHPTAALVGTILGSIMGGIVWGYLFGLLVGKLFQSKEPDERAICAAIGAWIVCAILAGFGFANGGGFNIGAGFHYLPGVVIAFFMLRQHYRKLWHDDEEVEDTQ